MAIKGSKYARKHRVEIPVENQHNSVTKKDEKDNDIWDILYSPDNFINDFLKLPYPRQIKMVEVLYEIIKNEQKSPSSGVKKAFANTAELHLKKIHEQTNSSYDEGIYYPLADDEKRLIRMDCYGSINKRQPHQLSMIYNYFKRPENRGKYKLAEYDLKTSPTWRVFNQFENFRNIAKKVQRYLYKNGFNPDLLKVMTVTDCCDIIYNAFKKNESATSAFFAPSSDNIKNRQVKNFMRNCGAIFEQRLLDKGHDYRLVKSLCNAMRRFGVCDLNAINVTETHYTPRILKDLHENDYDVSEIMVGDEISQNFIDELVDTHQEFLILARDENGNLLDKSGLPSIEMHHKHAVRFAANDGYLAQVNYPNNQLLVDSQMHSRYYHLFDRIIKEDKTQTFYSRLNVDSRIMCMVIGFDMEDAVYWDMENTPSFAKRKAMDKQCQVNYFEMMEERLHNEHDIVQKYNIKYSRASISQANISVKKIKERINYDEDKMKLFQAWLNSKQKSRRGK